MTDTAPLLEDDRHPLTAASADKEALFRPKKNGHDKNAGDDSDDHHSDEKFHSSTRHCILLALSVLAHGKTCTLASPSGRRERAHNARRYYSYRLRE